VIDPASVPEVSQDEVLARYVLHSSHIRANGTVKADAFMPYALVQMSVTRHLQASEAELWQVGAAVAATRQRTLYGRADITAQTCLGQKLSVVAAALAGNPNHANVGNWPQDKPAQKMIALEIAATASFVGAP
jgi:hypothetical protein